MKHVCGYLASWYGGAILTLGLVGGVGVEQALAQVSARPMQGAIPRGPGVTIHTVSIQQAQASVDYVNATAMPLPPAPNGSAAQAQDDLLATFAAQIPLAKSGAAMSGSPGTGVI